MSKVSVLHQLTLLLALATAFAATPLKAMPTPPAWLGVYVVDIPFERLDALGLPHGVEITAVAPHAPAAAAGLRAGDIITEYATQAVYSAERLRWLVTHAPREGEVSLGYYRDGQQQTTTVKLGAAAPQRHRPTPPARPMRAYLGVALQPMTDELRAAFGVPDSAGVLIVSVSADSPAHQAGLKAGDAIVKINSKTIDRITDVYRALDYFEPGDEITIEFIRAKANQSATVTLAQRPAPGPHAREYPWDYPGAYPGDPEHPLAPLPDLLQRGFEEFLERWRQEWQEHMQRTPPGEPAPL